DFRVIGWLRSTTYTASNFIPYSYPYQYWVYDNNNNYVRTLISSFNVNLYNGVEQYCETSGGVDHYAKTTFVVRYSGTEILESGGYYIKPIDGNCDMFFIKYSTNEQMNCLDDYSSSQDTRLITWPSGKNATEWKFLVLQYSPDGGTTWIDICESLDSNGTPDPNTGEYPCGICTCPKNTLKVIQTPPIFYTPIIYKTPIIFKTPIRYPYQ
ncbi:MAG: hypothetical protein ACUVQP_04890, partial [Bacteroidales bacterium]